MSPLSLSFICFWFVAERLRGAAVGLWSVPRLCNPEAAVPVAGCVRKASGILFFASLLAVATSAESSG